MTRFAIRSGLAGRTLKNKYTVSFIAGMFLIATALILPCAIFAADAPILNQPANNATGVATTNITFSWSQSGDTTDYYIEINTVSSFSPATEVLGEDVGDNQTSFFYSSDLEAPLTSGTNYYWRVMTDYPEVSSWSGVSSFTTAGSNQISVTPTPTPTKTPTTTPTLTATTTTNTTTTATNNTPAQTGSNSISGFVNSIGLPFIIGIVFILVVVVVLIWVLTSRPKRSAPVYAPGYGGGPIASSGSSIICQNCGFTNSSDRRFCANCGNNLIPEPQFKQQYQQPPQYQPVMEPQSTPWQGSGFGRPVNCPNCGFSNQPGKQFCGNCGSKLMTSPQQQPGASQSFQQQAIFCPNCGSPVQPGQQFCANCGANVSAVNQQVIGSYESFMCPTCGATITRGINPCPNCHTFLDWSA